jgi:hypothetical protein
MIVAFRGSLYRITMEENAKTSHTVIYNRLWNIQPGEQIIYFVGFLDAERDPQPSESPLNKIANLAYQLMLEGRVRLTQRRIMAPVVHGGMVDWHRGVGQGFEYIATGTTPRKEAMKVPERTLYNPLSKVLK